jgi:hypothetical protein
MAQPNVRFRGKFSTAVNKRAAEAGNEKETSSNRRHCWETEFFGRRQRGQNDFEKVKDTVAETTSR